MLHITTIIVFMVIIHILCAMVLTILWIQNRSRYQGTGLWALDFALKAVGLLLIVMRGVVPLWMATVFATFLILAGEMILFKGLAVFIQTRVQQLFNIFLLAAYIALHSYFTFGSDSLATRNLILSIAWLLIDMQILWLVLVKINSELRKLTVNTGIAVGIYCVINMARVINYFLYPNPEENYLQSGIFEAVILISFQIATILLTYSLSLMVNKRLSMDIEVQEEKYCKAFHSAPYAVLLTRKCDGRIFEANRGFELMSGYTIAEATGKTTPDLNLFSVAGTREQILNELNEKGIVRDRELDFRVKSGEIKTGLYSADTLTINNQLCVISTISDITRRKAAEAEREKMIGELKTALAEIKTLSGMLPICSSCKKIRNDRGYWQQIESYIREHSDAQFSHSLCPDCIKRLYPEYADMVEGNDND